MNSIYPGLKFSNKSVKIVNLRISVKTIYKAGEYEIERSS